MDGEPLKTKYGMSYVENPHGKTFSNVKMGLKQQIAGNRGFFDDLLGTVKKVTPVVGDLAKVVVKHI